MPDRDEATLERLGIWLGGGVRRHVASQQSSVSKDFYVWLYDVDGPVGEGGQGPTFAEALAQALDSA